MYRFLQLPYSYLIIQVFYDVKGMLCRSLSHLMMQERWMEDAGVDVEDMEEEEKTDGLNCDTCLVRYLDTQKITVDGQGRMTGGNYRLSSSI